MTEKVSTLQHLMIGGGEYIFLIANESDPSTEIQDAVTKAFEALGRSVRIKGKTVRSTLVGRNDTFEELTSKSWPISIRQRMEEEEEPFLVILKTDFRAFDPKQHDWRIIWFSNVRSPKNSIKKLCGVFKRRLERDQDLFQFLDSIRMSKHFKPEGADHYKAT